MMDHRLNLVAISGSPRTPSRTDALVKALSRAIERRVPVGTIHLAIPAIADTIFPALTRQHLSAEGEEIIRSIEAADILVVGTPVYRASFTGLLKHLFDLVRYDALAGKISVLAASGGSPLHGLVTEHQLRPLLSFFGTHTVPTTIYAEERDFTDDYRIANPAIEQRIERAAAEIRHVLARGTAEKTPILQAS